MPLRPPPLPQDPGRLGGELVPGRRPAGFSNGDHGVPQVWEVSSEAHGPSWPEQLTFYEERVSSAEYSPIQNRLLFGMDSGGNERTQLFLLEGGEVTDLTAPPTPSTTPAGSPGRRARGVHGDEAQRDGLRRLRAGARRRARGRVGGPRLPHRLRLGPDGSALIVSRHHSNLNNDLYRLNLETEKRRCSRRTRATPGSPRARHARRP